MRDIRSNGANSLRCLPIVITALLLVGCKPRPVAKLPPKDSDVASLSTDANSSDSKDEADIGKPSLPQPKPDVPRDDAAAVAMLEALTDKLRQDGDGLIIEVDLRGQEFKSAALDALKKLPRLRSVKLAGTAVSDDDLKAIGQVATLEDLDLRDCAIGDDGLAHLTSLQRLKALRLSGKNGNCTVGDDGMVHVAKLKNLKVFAADYLFAFSDDGLAQLAGLKNIVELYLGGTATGNDSISHMVENYPNLRKLRFAQNQIDKDGVALLPKLTKLEELDLSECSQLFDDSMGPLAEMKQLKRLNLWRVSITDAGVKPLQGLTNIEWLNLDNTQLSDVGLEYLSGMTKAKFMHLGSTFISDAGLKHLESLTSLDDLKVTRTAVTEDGVANLKKSLPDTEIQLLYIEGE